MLREMEAGSYKVPISVTRDSGVAGGLAALNWLPLGIDVPVSPIQLLHCPSESAGGAVSLRVTSGMREVNEMRMCGV